MADEKVERITMPHSVADMQAITHIPTTEATASFGRFMNKYLVNADNFAPLTEEQAWCVIAAHRVWQQSEERKQEKLELAANRKKEDEEKAKEREEKAKEKAAEKERKAAEKKAADEKKAAEKAAKEAAGEGTEDTSDLDDTDDTNDSEKELAGVGSVSKKARRRAPAATEGSDTDDGF